MKKRVKALIILTGAVATLFAINSFYISNHNPMLSENVKTVDTTHVSPQKLFYKNWHIIRDEYYDPTLNHQHWSKWKNHYHGKIKTEDDAKVAIDTMLASLNDPYSNYLTKDEFARQNTFITSKISGIGVNIINDSGKIIILSVIEETPAQFADLKAGDIILAVDGKKTSGLSLADVANLVKGPVNSFVTLDILRGNEKYNKKIIRKEFSVKTVKSNNFDDIGYIQISSFLSNSTPNEFLDALEKTQKTKGLIVDLRGNTGGLLTNAIFISNLFIEKGRLVSIVGRNGYRYDVEAQSNDVSINKPIILLVDGASASASEIFSGAMKDYNRAKLIGTKTYGKGMVQKIIPMPNETGLNLTIAKYLTPNGTDINKQGISPDVTVEISEKDIKEKHDVQLETAKNLLSKMIDNNES